MRLPLVAIVLATALRTSVSRWTFTAATGLLSVSSMFLVLR